ncbi:MAG: LysR family transcriptional regulator [Hyphobacterium sp.]|nr:MAG: LysR family transcriptional regulator [Hyphobacterium sp.]
MNNWIEYQIALAIHEGGSHAAAAKLLNVSQPTISRGIRALEERLGEALFQRRGGENRPTETGKTIIRHAMRMRDDAAAIERSAGSANDEIAGEVIISASDGVGGDWLPHVLAPLRDRHPGLVLRIDLGMQKANLAAGEADIALRWRSPGEQQSLIVRKAATVGWGLYAAPSYLEKFGRPWCADHLKPHRLVDWGYIEPEGWPTGEAGDIVRPAEIAVIANSATSHLQAMKSGFGIGMTSHRLARLAGPALERVLAPHETVQELYLVAHDGVNRSRRHRLVFDHLADSFKRDSAHFRKGDFSVFFDA